MTPAAIHELEALRRLGAARDCLDAVLAGHWPADPDVVAGIGRLLTAGERRLRWAEEARKVAA